MMCISFNSGNFRSKAQSQVAFGGGDYSSPDPLSLADISHEGVYGEYFFETGAEEKDQTFNINTSTAVVKDPLSGNPETWLAVGLHSKYDGDGVKEFGRPPVNLVIVLDVSGSMSSTFESSEGAERRSKMEIAKTSLQTMCGHLKPDDSLGIVLFNYDATTLQLLEKWSEIDQTALTKKITSIHAGGGTNLSCGFVTASSMLEAAIENQKGDRRVENRIIFLTDMRPNQGEISEGGLFGIAARCANMKIYSTFIGVGLDFNSELVEHITKNIKGSHYLTVNNDADFTELMDENFDYTIFPLVFDMKISLISDGSSITIDKVYGSREANEATGELMKIATIFPSAKQNGMTKGGVVMLKLKTKQRDGEDEDGDQEMKAAEGEGEGEGEEGGGLASIGTFQLTVTYEDSVAQKTKKIEHYIELKNREANYFENDGVRKGVLLTQYVNLIKAFINKNVINQETGIPGSVTETSNYSQNLDEEGRDIFKQFTDYFKEEMKVLGDDNLKQDLKVLDRIFQLPA